MPVVKETPTPKIATPKENARPRTTLNLGNILKPTTKTEEITEVKNTAPARQDEPVTESKLRQIWNEYAELKKNQVAEYHLLNQSYSFLNNTVTLQLTNPIEEPLLQGLKADLISYLRDKLNNSTLQVEGILQQEGTVKRKAYTNKEKFEYLAEKNPLLRQLQQKLGLDPDF